MIKIAIVGPESSGKSKLSKSLADHFQTSMAKEMAREFLSKTEGSYSEKDLVAMAKLQIEEERRASSNANQLYFCDTNLLNFIIWSQVKYGRISEELVELWNPDDFHLHLLCLPDLPYEEDPLRESPAQEERDYLFDLHKEYLEEVKAPYVVIEGIDDIRTQRAIDLVNELL